MTHLSERADLGIFVLQDHAARQDGTPIGMRQCLAGVRVIDIPDPDGNTEPVRFGSDRQFGTIGDVHPWMFWQTRDRGTREMGSWAQVFGGMVVSASPQYGAAAMQPWRENWTTDPRYAFKNAGVAAGMSWYPEGSMLIFLPGTDENQQYEHAMWADSRLIAPNADGPGECGTLVCDLGAAGEICMSRSARPGIGGRHARLQTLMRVIAVPEQQSFAGMGAEGNVLALNYGWTGTDAIPGFGAVFGPIDGRSSGPITGGGTRGPNTGQASGSERGGRGDPRAQSVGNDPFGDPLIGNAADGGVTPNDIGLFRRNPTQGSGVGLMASMGPGGPLHLGNASDKHQLGFDADGHPINAGHISTTACYYHDGTFDAPIEFTPMMYPDPPGFPFKTRTHLFYDPKSFHAFGQGAARGLWRLWSEMPDMTPKKPPPITPRPPAPPLPPNDPPPPPGGPPTGGPPTGGPPTGGPPGGPPGGPGTGGPGAPGGGGPGGPAGGPITPTGRRPGDPRRPDPYPVGGGLDELPPDYPQGKHYPGGDQGGQGGTSDGPQDPGDGPTTGGGNGGNGGQGLCYDSDYRRRVSRNPASLANSAFFSGNGYAAQAFIGRGNQIGARARSSYTGGSGVAFGTPGSDPREAMGRWSGLDPWTREPEEIPGLRERIGSQEPGQVGTYAMTRPLFWSTSAFAFRPQLWIDKYPNFERNPQLPESMWENDERVRPQTVVMRAWGMQSTGEGDWDYVERPMQSRARGGTVSGGVVFMPARFEFEDYLGIGVTQDVEDTGAATATDTHVLLAPGVNLSFGTPAVHGASPIDANAVRMYRDSSANNYAWRLEVAGVPAMRAYKLAGNPVVEFYNGTTWSSVGVAGIPDGEITDDLTIDGGSLFVYDDVSGGEAVIDLKNDAASGASGALQKIRTSGSSTGDAWTRYENPSRYFSVGLDTSTDEFRIGTGATLATGNLFRLTSAGVAHFVNDVQLGSTVSGSYSLIVNSGFSTQSDVELRQGGLTNVRIAALAAGGAAFQVDGASLGTPVTIWSVTTGNLLDMQAKRVTNAGDPTSAQDVATKAYVDAVELGDLDDVSAGSAVSGHLLVYDGGQWVSVDYWHRDGWEQQTDHLFISNSSGASTFYHGGSDIEAGTPGGIVRAFSNTTAGAYTAARYKGKVLLGDGYVWECKMQVYGTTTSGTVRIGIGDSNTGAAPGEGAYFEYDQATSGNWRFVTVAGSTPTATTSSTAVSFSTWLTLRIEVGASSIEFFVDGVSIGSSSTNLPTSSGSQAEMFWLQVQNSAGNNTRAQVDHFRIWRAA